MEHSITQEKLDLADKTIMLKLKSNQSVSVKTDNQESLPFYKISKQKKELTVESITNRRIWDVKGINFLQELCMMSKSELRVIALIEERIGWDESLQTYNYIANISQYDFPSLAEYKQFSSGYRTLFKRDIVRRVGKAAYMINPAMLIPSGETAYFNQIWNTSKDSSDGVIKESFFAKVANPLQVN